MDELRAPGMEKTNLRPRSFNCQVTVDRLHASWTEVCKEHHDAYLVKNLMMLGKTLELPENSYSCYQATHQKP